MSLRNKVLLGILVLFLIGMITTLAYGYFLLAIQGEGKDVNVSVAELKIKEANFKRIDNLATIIANKNNVKKSFVKRDMIKNFIKYGIGYTDYFKGDYINRTEEEKKTFLTAKNYVPILNYLNKKSYRVV